jgi:Anaphase-promoting complex, cyclosome, subunit 3
VREDRYGLPVTTTSDTAFDAYSTALDLALTQQAGAVDRLQQALTADPGFALAWALLAMQQRASGDLSAGASSLTTALSLEAALSDRERSHLNVLQKFTTFNVPEVEAAIHDHLDRWACDAFIVMQAHYLYNLFDPRPDRDQRLLAMDERLAPSYGNDWFMLGELAFATEENGEYARARELAERSLAAKPANSTAAHALAHVYLETGDIEAGVAWLDGWLAAWENPSVFACHLTWHLALLQLAADKADHAIALLDQIIGFVDSPFGVLADGASLAWRLEVDRASVTLPWEQLVALPDRPGFTFANAHHALALTGAGDVAGLRAYGLALDEVARTGHPTAGLCATFSRALADLSANDASSAADQLAALLPAFRTFGGSHAQTEVFEDAAIAALETANRRGEARELLDKRLARRRSARDDRWLARMTP